MRDLWSLIITVYLVEAGEYQYFFFLKSHYDFSHTARELSEHIEHVLVFLETIN
jgi:hypothetical protein